MLQNSLGIIYMEPKINGIKNNVNDKRWKFE